MKNIGKLLVSLAWLHVLVDNHYEQQQVYLAKDPEQFLAHPDRHYQQRVHRVVGNMLVMGSPVRVASYSPGSGGKEVLTQLSELVEVVQEPNLVSVANLCAGADTSDFIHFWNAETVSELTELKQLGSDLSYGLGFPGRGYALVVAEYPEGYSQRRIFLQTVDSEMEGYSVQHQEMTPALAAFAQLPRVQELLST